MSMLTKTPPRESGPAAAARTSGRVLMRLVRAESFGAGAATVLALVVFAAWAPHFLTAQSLADSVQVAAELGIVAIAVTLLMIAGEFDLSVGSVIGLTALVAAEALKAGWPEPIAILAAFAAAAVVGAINGVLVAFTRAPSLIVTLAAMFVWQGVVYVVTQGFAVSVSLSGISQALFAGTIHGFAVSAIWWLVLIMILGTVLLRTGLGNHIFATGGNLSAARNLGVPVRRIKVGLFILTALSAGLVGVIQLVRFGSADPTLGQNVELTAIAATVIGGTRLQGGAGTVLGTAFGCLTLGFIEVGLQLASVPTYFFQGLVGLILLAAVLVNLYLRGRRTER
jgi:simple sugar transport system permease protein